MGEGFGNRFLVCSFEMGGSRDLGGVVGFIVVVRFYSGVRKEGKAYLGLLLVVV